MNSLESSHSKAMSENSDISQQLSEAESKVSSLTKAKQQLEAQLDETKSDLQSETSVRIQYIYVMMYNDHCYNFLI